MPIVAPARDFAGSEMETGSGFKYIRPEVPQVLISEKENPNGIHLFFLPGYKDGGVWFKQFQVRQNFGTQFREKYVMPNPADDPASYFESKFKMFWPEEAKPKEVERSGKNFKDYPPYGNVSKRVVYNVLKAKNPEEGAHVLDLPLFNGASQIAAYHDAPSFKGEITPLISDPTRCALVYIKCKSAGAKGNPWSIKIDLSEAVALPENLCSSEYLNNLDEIFVPKGKNEIIAKLREFFPQDVFDRCMHGYPGLVTGAVQGFNPPAAVASALTPVKLQHATAPAVSAAKFAIPAGLNIPKAPVISQAPVEAPASAEPVATEAPVVTTLESNPMPSLLLQGLLRHASRLWPSCKRNKVI